MALAFAQRLTKPATINFNDRIRLKLTEVGWQAHRDWHTEIFAMAGISRATAEKDFPYKAPPVGEDGCCEFHLWEVANIFGRKLYNGCNPPFELEGVLSPISFYNPGDPLAPQTGGYAPKGREVDLS